MGDGDFIGVAGDMVGPVESPVIVEVRAGSGDAEGVVGADGNAFADRLGGDLRAHNSDDDGLVAGDFAGEVGDGDRVGSGIGSRDAGENEVGAGGAGNGAGVPCTVDRRGCRRWRRR